MATKKKPAAPAASTDQFEMFKNNLYSSYGQDLFFDPAVDEVRQIARFSAGCYSIDKALGGGWPEGRIIEVLGYESSGKTTVLIHALIEAQKKYPDKRVGFIDAEQAFDMFYATQVGIDPHRLLLVQPDTSEQALDILKQMTASGLFSAIVLDSVAALVPQQEIDKSMSEGVTGVLAKEMARMLRIVNTSANETNTTIFFVNQYRMKIGVMFGDPRTTPGGESLKFFSSIRIEVKKKEVIKAGEDSVGINVEMKIIKNKTAAPYRLAEYQIVFGKGIDILTDLVLSAEKEKLLTKSGSWYAYQGNNIGQGLDKTCKYLEQNPTVLQALRDKLNEKVSGGMDYVSEGDDDMGGTDSNEPQF